MKAKELREKDMDGLRQELEGRLRLERRRRDRPYDLLEERHERFVRGIGGLSAQALSSVAVENRELELLLRRIQVDEQVVDLVEDLLGPGVGAVDLVDNHDR